MTEPTHRAAEASKTNFEPDPDQDIWQALTLAEDRLRWWLDERNRLEFGGVTAFVEATAEAGDFTAPAVLSDMPDHELLDRIGWSDDERDAIHLPSSEFADDTVGRLLVLHELAHLRPGPAPSHDEAFVRNMSTLVKVAFGPEAHERFVAALARLSLRLGD